MSILNNQYDALEKLIFDENWKITAIDINKELDLFLVNLNTKAILRQKISDYPRLAKATQEQLLQYELIAGGTGVHWEDLDEDLSLKGFLQEELKNVVRKPNAA